MKVIEIDNLVKKFGDHTAVNGLSLTIEQGEVFGLLGPNGAGKSTTINLVCGLLHATSGDVKLFGKPADAEKSKLGFVPQNIALYDNFTAYENVKFFGELYGLRGKELESGIDEALEFTGLSDVRRKKAKTFSGGMLRRLNIAAALVHNPQLIIMDEPTVGIDPQSRNHILKSVQRLNEKGVTVVYTTHYMEEVETLCNRIAIIDQGKVIASGTKKELTALIDDKKSLHFTVDNAFELSKEELGQIEGVINVEIGDNEVQVESLKEVDNLHAIMEYVSHKQVKVRDIGFRDVTLETVFLTLTGRKLRD
ncbi:ABC transporter ATP-binding protein ['Paenibacillus yunnanensis' Narsing Rao et al. 2020]|uniref:ABC transporter ATP-binding protein n=1 Tax=Paenibacillus tengchongensis TaxID=2608684 RepID=UPI00124DDE28|nr:ABC transporter ATP-binding protein [Paenibacillus tengchongensis]